MKEEYLNQAANDYCHVNLYDGKYCRQDVYEAFQDGMKHAMELPLADRLSESEKEKIRKFYHTIWGKGLNKLQHELSEIFGKTLFNPTEQ